MSYIYINKKKRLYLLYKKTIKNEKIYRTNRNIRNNNAFFVISHGNGRDSAQAALRRHISSDNDCTDIVGISYKLRGHHRFHDKRSDKRHKKQGLEIGLVLFDFRKYVRHGFFCSIYYFEKI